MRVRRLSWLSLLALVALLGFAALVVRDAPAQPLVFRAEIQITGTSQGDIYIFVPSFSFRANARLEGGRVVRSNEPLVVSRALAEDDAGMQLMRLLMQQELIPSMTMILYDYEGVPIREYTLTKVRVRSLEHTLDGSEIFEEIALSYAQVSW